MSESLLQRIAPIHEYSPKLQALQLHFNIYNNYLSLLASGLHLKRQSQQLQAKRTSLLRRIQTIQANIMHKQDVWILIEEKEESIVLKPKRIRRLDVQIQKTFLCHHERCRKCYGSMGSLQQHLRLKHNEIIQSYAQSNTPPSP